MKPTAPLRLDRGGPGFFFELADALSDALLSALHA